MAARRGRPVEVRLRGCSPRRKQSRGPTVSRSWRMSSKYYYALIVLKEMIATKYDYDASRKSILAMSAEAKQAQEEEAEVDGLKIKLLRMLHERGEKRS